MLAASAPLWGWLLLPGPLWSQWHHSPVALQPGLAPAPLASPRGFWHLVLPPAQPLSQPLHGMFSPPWPCPRRPEALARLPAG